MDIDRLKKQLDSSDKRYICGLVSEGAGSYTKSPALWEGAFNRFNIDAEYLVWDIPKHYIHKALALLLAHPKVKGFNITTPYKELAADIPIIELDGLSFNIKSINTIDNGFPSIGYSTDGYGACTAIERASHDYDFRGKNAVVIGAAGTARSIAQELLYRGANVTIANRTFKHASEAVQMFDENMRYDGYLCAMRLRKEDGAYPEHLINALQQSDMIINATPAEKTGNRLFSPEDIRGKDKICLDAAYGHQSKFLKAAAANGYLGIGGEEMLLHQAVKSFSILFDNEDLASIENAMRFSEENKVLGQLYDKRF